MQSPAQLHEGTLPHWRTPCAGEPLRHFTPHPALSGKKGPQRSPSWAWGLTITRLPVTGLQLPSALCPHPHIRAQGRSSWS